MKHFPSLDDLRARFDVEQNVEKLFQRVSRALRHVEVSMISSGFPEQGGGGSSAAKAHAPASGFNAAETGAAEESTGGEGAPAVAAADDDDDGGDGDGEDDCRRPRSKKSPPSFPPALLAFEPLSHYVGFGRSRIYQLINAGEFPPPVKIGKSSRWVRAEIDNWLSAQIAARPTTQHVGG